jgi:serine protease Do
MERQPLAALRGDLGRRKLLSLTLLLFTLAIGMILGTVISRDVGAARKGQAAPDAKLLTIPDPVPIENEFTRIARQARASVVHIKVEALPKKTESRAPRERSETDEMFRRFFGIPEGLPEGGPFPHRRRPGEGSGVIVDENGYILTNHHVIVEADRIRVRLFQDGDNGEEKLFDAKLIGFDPETDLAVIKIDSDHKLNPAPIGNSDAVHVGDWAIAVGSPFGYRETVTVGIISAKSRQVDAAGPVFQRFLQTDAAINPGNSGGPLLNLRGEVVGINTAIISRSGGSEGLGFALPSNMAVNVYNQIIQYGRMTRGSIGVSFPRNQHPALLRSYGAQDGGVLVREVTKGGPAEKAGMKEEDVIIEIGGKPVRNGDELIKNVAGTPVGETVPVVVLRDGAKKTLNVEIADRSVLFAEELGYSDEEEEEKTEATQMMFGISVSNLSSSQREQLGYKESEGVLVTEVEPASFSDDIGVVANDIIVAINRKPISDVEDIRGIQQELKPGDDVAVKVMRRIPSGPDGRLEWVSAYLAGVLPQGKGKF